MDTLTGIITIIIINTHHTRHIHLIRILILTHLIRRCHRTRRYLLAHQYRRLIHHYRRTHQCRPIRRSHRILSGNDEIMMFVFFLTVANANLASLLRYTK
ncbi:hypothetical protein [Taibaiella soli]|uniref:hypothetical protein n=1 Tax=Taibaiella soli TaxID=1649169 RepID=UPI000F4E6818|nr:hypothetical protein [Taibaiella soli]